MDDDIDDVSNTAPDVLLLLCCECSGTSQIEVQKLSVKVGNNNAKPSHTIIRTAMSNINARYFPLTRKPMLSFAFQSSPQQEWQIQLNSSNDNSAEAEVSAKPYFLTIAEFNNLQTIQLREKLFGSIHTC
jgi:hypothetical protein